MLTIVVLAIAFIGSLAAAIAWEFTQDAEVPAWIISVVSALGGGLLGILIPKGTTPQVLIGLDADDQQNQAPTGPEV
jgi:hypothetical protein